MRCKICKKCQRRFAKKRKICGICLKRMRDKAKMINRSFVCEIYE